MQPLKPAMSGAEAPKYVKWLGWWGHLSGHGQVGQAQRGVVTYTLSPNEVGITRKMFCTHAKWFTIRLGRQAWAFLPAPLLYYGVPDWSQKKNHFLASKEGILKEGGGHHD